MRDIVPFRDQMRGHENGFAALGFEVKRFLQPFAPAGIEAQARFIEQQDRSIRQKQESETEPLPHPAGKLARATRCATSRKPASSSIASQRESGDAAQAARKNAEFPAGEPRMKTRPLRQIGERTLRGDSLLDDVDIH